MSETIRLRLKPEESADRSALERRIAEKAGKAPVDFRITRKSIDARQRQVWVEMDVLASFSADDPLLPAFNPKDFKPVAPDAPQVVIVGAGPAGLFAALRAIELGWRPVVVERGKPVEDRLHDVVALQKSGKLDPESNFCFGEGGAGAFSDGKLFTRSKKRGDVKEVLALLHQHGAKEDILYETHPHIGSDKLPGVIRNIRHRIVENGGEILFSTKFESLVFKDGEVAGIVTEDGREISGPVILATGHSAKDVYRYLHSAGVPLEAKGFAMGVRLEHPQQLIDSIIYHNPKGRGEYLPAAEYRMAVQVDGRGVYSFCMCPGGVIVPAVSAAGESVVNGMSSSARSGRWANSGMVVEIRPEDIESSQPENVADEMGMLEFQQGVEKRFFEEAKSLSAPAQRMKDFVDGKLSKSLPPSSYVPGLHPADLSKLLPPHVSDRLRKGLRIMGKRYPGFLTNDAVLIGLESRTSSPVRISRDPETLHHPAYKGLYPAGEGAGYAGGIVSAAIDGINAMNAIAGVNRQKADDR
ncbi:MAG: FAD-binding protein [Muribaculaceae bacterium]|nr:FAD-binding protein [Muribaculaceae bacterium]